MYRGRPWATTPKIGKLTRHAPHERLRSGAGEEGRQLVELLALPAIGLVVVALGALDLHAEEDPRDLAGHLHGLGLVRQREADRAVLVDAAGGGDHRRGDLVPGCVLLELLSQPVFQEVVAHLLDRLVGGVEPDHVAPVAGPVAGIFGALEQSVSQPGALILGPVADERKNLLRSRWRAGQIEVNPPHELDVTGERRGLDLGAELAQVLLDELVELRRGDGRRRHRARRTLGQGGLGDVGPGARFIALAPLHDGPTQLLKRLKDVSRVLFIKFGRCLLGLIALGGRVLSRRLAAACVIPGLRAEGDEQRDAGRAGNLRGHDGQQTSPAANPTAPATHPVHATHVDHSGPRLDPRGSRGRDLRSCFPPLSNTLLTIQPRCLAAGVA